MDDKELCPLCYFPLDHPYPTHLERDQQSGIRFLCRHSCMDGSGEGTYGEFRMYISQLEERKDAELHFAAKKIHEIDAMLIRVMKEMTAIDNPKGTP